jgi:hypothetical protein
MNDKETDMTKYTVLQINLTDDQIDEVNAAKGDYPEFYSKYLRTNFQPKPEAILDAFDMYKPVAKIEADSLEGVFHIGNIGPEENIERLDRMHSLSVGDLVFDPNTGIYHYVDSFGFGELSSEAVLKNSPSEFWKTY